MSEIMRTFETGATRSSDVGKHDFEGYLSPLVLEAFAEYMTSHRIQADGKTRDSDNWQKGMGLRVAMKSAWRHFFDWWKCHRGYGASVDKTTGKQMTIDDALCGLMFNINVYYHELLLARRQEKQAIKDLMTPPILVRPQAEQGG